MFFDQDIKGDRLPPGTLCLTYDDGPGETPGDSDGPGPRTSELGRYLHDQGIAATFFVIGRHAEAHRETLARLRDWGHLVGNHTYSHPGLVPFARQGGDVVEELARTDAIIRGFVTSNRMFFRAPYGNWRDIDPETGKDMPNSIVADALNRCGQFPDYVGPINWDIVASDWEFWRRGRSAEACAGAYLNEIRRVGRGIVLMHDSSEQEEMRAGNRAMQATALMVPMLKDWGFCFVRLDEVPEVRSAMASGGNLGD
jgi:peptidoglycan/xylan/chitin deacetylase (PgdA/CDA1 family)